MHGYFKKFLLCYSVAVLTYIANFACRPFPSPTADVLKPCKYRRGWGRRYLRVQRAPDKLTPIKTFQ